MGIHESLQRVYFQRGISSKLQDKITNIITYFYDSSKTAKKIISEIQKLPDGININYQKGQFGVENTLIVRVHNPWTKMSIDTEFLGNLREIGLNGKPYKIDLGIAIMHELIHYVYLTTDPSKKDIRNGNYIGETVAIENKIRSEVFSELKIPQRNTYFDIIHKNAPALFGKNGFTNGFVVDSVVITTRENGKPFIPNLNFSNSNKDFLIIASDDTKNVFKTGGGQDFIYGYTGDDIIQGGGGNDVIAGGDNNDIITGGSGKDKLYGELGNDIFNFAAGDVVSGEIIDGGGLINEDNRISGSGTNDFGIATVTAISEILFLDGGGSFFFNAKQLSETGLSPRLLVYGSNSTDSLTFSGGVADTQKLTFFTNMPEGVTLDMSGLRFSGWSEYDTLRLVGSDLSDTITGTSQSDSIHTFGGNDFISAGNGNDLISGGSGRDQMYGGAGNDTFRFVQDDVVKGEIIDGGSNQEINRIAGGGNVYFGQASISAISEIQFRQGGGSFTFNADQVSDAGISLNSKIFGSAAADTFVFLVSNTNSPHIDLSGFSFDTANPWGTDDRIYIVGSSAADTMTGTSHNDIMDGGDGADSIRGGAGNDSLYGGTGIDIAYYSGNYSEYAVSSSGQLSGTVSSSVSKDAGTDGLSGIEFAVFADQVYNFKNGQSFAYTQLDNLSGSVSGTFYDPAPIDSIVYGVGTSSFTWGGGEASTLSFKSSGFSVKTDQTFKLGTITYYNGVGSWNKLAESVKFKTSIDIDGHSNLNFSLDLKLILLATSNSGTDIQNTDSVKFGESGQTFSVLESRSASVDIYAKIDDYFTMMKHGIDVDHISSGYGLTIVGLSDPTPGGFII